MFLFSIRVWSLGFHSTAMYACCMQDPSFCKVSNNTNSGSIDRKGFSSISNNASDGNFVFIAWLINYNGTRDMWWDGIVTVLAVIKCIFCSISFCSYVDNFCEAMIHCPESIVFKEEAIFLPSHLRNNFPLISHSFPILYLWAKFSPKIKCCFNFTHTTKLFVKICSSIFKSHGAIPIGPNVAPLRVFTFNGFIIRLIL